jgi:hypothetical protein
MNLVARGCRLCFQFLPAILAAIVLVFAGCSNQPAKLAVDPSSLDFGEVSDELDLSITNLGTQTLTWKITLEQPVSWCLFSPDSGTDDGMALVTVDRSKLSPGVQNAVLVLESNGGNIKVPVSATGPTTGGIEIHEPLPE